METIKFKELSSEQIEELKFKNVKSLIEISIGEYLKLKEDQKRLQTVNKEMSDNW